MMAYAGPLIVFNDNGGWCWYQDERVIVYNNKLIIGSIADASGSGGAARDGDVEVAAYDLVNQSITRFTLHDALNSDDHAAPAFLVRPDGRILSMYAKHGGDVYARYRITVSPGDTSAWQPEQLYTASAGVTYSNLFRLSSTGKTYNFYRGENYNPNVLISSDDGSSWTYAGRLIRIGTGGTRPYVKYASNNTDKIWFSYTDGHPRDVADNNIYVAYLQGTDIYNAYGTDIGNLSPSEGIAPSAGTIVYDAPADGSQRGWTSDMHLDAAGWPVVAYTTRISNDDHRYRYARFDGTKWTDYQIAYAGQCLYTEENDYTGLITLDPRNPDIVYISANVHPVTGAPLISSADGRRHWEIFRGITDDGGATWRWEYITKNSAVDNIRPVVPIWDDPRTILLWMRGTYYTYTNYNTQIVGMIDPEAISPDSPEITRQPESAAAPIGQTAMFTVQAVGREPLNYVWYKVDSSGDTAVASGSAAWILSDIQPSDYGWYYCIVSNSAGSAMSSLVRLMPAELTAWWPLDGSYADATGHGYNAMPAGSPVFAAGHTGQAVHFNGSSYLNCTNGSSLTLQNGGTISAWVKADPALQNTAWATVVAKGRWAWRLCRYGFGSGNSISFHFNSPNYEYQANGSIPALDNTWHHLAATYDGQSIKLYVDGQLDASAATPELVNSNADPVYIANRSDAARYWVGLIDDVRIYSFAMDAAAVGLLYQDKSCYQLNPYDVNRDCRIDLDDWMVFAADWLDSGIDPQTQVCSANPQRDLTGPQGAPDCRVNLCEFAQLASFWLDCLRLPASDCVQP
ncbi:MAG: BNR-4 repeat-containing protein [Phycisphaerae bacterium]|nr:BNR-4 repeat-containing protein [Phycisphaerae bacterium]